MRMVGWACCLALVLALPGTALGLTIERSMLAGRRVDALPVADARALLIWLCRRDEKPRLAAEWWRDSGLPQRGVQVVCPPPAGHAWDSFDDRPYLLRLEAELRRTTGLDAARVFIGGHGDGAALAHRLQMSLPERFAGVILARGIAKDPWPDRVAERRWIVGLSINLNDQSLPVAAVRERLARWTPEEALVHLDIGNLGDQIGPPVWRVAEQVIRSAGVVLPEGSTDEPAGDGAALEDVGGASPTGGAHRDSGRPLDD